MTKSLKAINIILALLFTALYPFYSFAQNRVVVVPIGDSFASTGYFTVQPADLRPADETQEYDIQIGANVNTLSGSSLTCPSTESQGEFLAPVYLPHGVLVQTFHLHGFDNDAGDQMDGILKKVCQSGNSAPLITELTPTLSSSGNPGYFELMTNTINANERVDNDICHYHIAIDLELSGCAGSLIAFNKARVFWRR